MHAAVPVYLLAEGSALLHQTGELATKQQSKRKNTTSLPLQLPLPLPLTTNKTKGNKKHKHHHHQCHANKPSKPYKNQNRNKQNQNSTHNIHYTQLNRPVQQSAYSPPPSPPNKMALPATKHHPDWQVAPRSQQAAPPTRPDPGSCRCRARGGPYPAVAVQHSDRSRPATGREKPTRGVVGWGRVGLNVGQRRGEGRERINKQ